MQRYVSIGRNIDADSKKKNSFIYKTKSKKSKLIGIMKKSKIQLLLSKLRNPLPLDFISKNILEVSEDDAREILSQLIKEDVIEINSQNYKIKNNYGKR
jgi:hypothetical protein